MFLNWYESQNKEMTDTLSFQALMIAPGFDAINDGMSGDLTRKFRQYLESETDASKISGKAVFVRSAIDFLTFDFDNIDTLIDSQNKIKRGIDKGIVEGRNMDILKLIHEKGADRFEERKEFKKEWVEFRDNRFTYNYIDEFLMKSLLG